MNEKINKKDMVGSVMDRLQSEHIEPRSRLYWVMQEYAIWALWSLSVLFGALAVAVLYFASIHTGYALYEVAHESFLTFAVKALPYLWLGFFLLMVLLAYFNLRHTKHGYKYPFTQVVLSSLGFSLLGGLGLHFFGVGYQLDMYLGRMSDMYKSRAEVELQMWQEPAAGKLVGKLTKNNEETANFEDIEGELWRLDTTELKERDMRVLQSGKQVRLLGIPPASASNVIHACGVFPWMLDHEPFLKEFREDRQEFIARMVEVRSELLKKVPPLNDPVSDKRSEGLCHELPILERMPNR